MTEDLGPLPQLPSLSDAMVTSVEWLFEPAWRGDRLMVRLQEGRVTLTDAAGQPAGEEYGEVAEVIEPAVDAADVLIDGIWTGMPFLGEGSPARLLAETLEEEGLADEMPDPLEMEKRRAFVAIDLVELDGQSLQDVPYLERRRLLASVIGENVQVRISPAVRNPIHNWLNAWRANGFTHYVAKHANSRYHPGEIADDWLQIPTAERRLPSAMGRLVGARPKKVARIHDERR